MSPSTTISDIASLSAEVGLISFQGELKMPFGKNRRWCWQHARRTWIIAFQLVENSLKYSFSDYNMRYIFHSNNHKNIYLYLLHGNFNLKTEGSVGTSKIIEFCISLVITTMLISVSTMPPPTWGSTFQLFGTKTKPK